MGDDAQYSTKLHSWFNGTCHICRSGGKLVRGVIKELIVRHSRGVVLRVIFVNEDNKIKSKLTSPFNLAALQVMWMDTSIVSDDDYTCKPEQSDTSNELLHEVQLQLYENKGAAFPALFVQRIEDIPHPNVAQQIRFMCFEVNLLMQQVM